MMTTYADWQIDRYGSKLWMVRSRLAVRFKCECGKLGTVDDVTLNRISD